MMLDWRSSSALGLAVLALLALATYRPLYSQLGEPATSWLDEMRKNHYQAEKTRTQLATYYENLIFEGSDLRYFLNQRYLGYRHSIADWDPFEGSESTYWQPVDDLREIEPRPSSVVPFDGVAHSFNRFGMRDREYSEKPADGVYRIVVLGSSNTMGRGVADGRPFEAIFEEKLNQLSQRQWTRYESLNLAYDAYTVVKQLAQIDAGTVMAFEPRLILLATHSVHDFWEPRFIDLAMGREYERIRYPFLIKLAKRLRWEWGHGGQRVYLTDREREQVVEWSYAEILQRCEENSVKCVAVGVPLPHSEHDSERLKRHMDRIASTGMPILSLHESFEEYDITEFQRAQWDDLHLNERGHEIVAENLYRALLEVDASLGLALATTEKATTDAKDAGR